MLFRIKTKVSLKYFVSYCRYEVCSSGNIPQVVNSEALETQPLQIHKNRCRITFHKNSNDLFNIYACIWLFKRLSMEIYVYVHIPLHAFMHMYIRKINYKQTDVTKVIFKNLSNKTRWKMCIMEFSLCGRNNTFLFYEKGRNGIINM